MGRKKREIKEPDVIIPEGDIHAGKTVFDDLCSGCHIFEVKGVWNFKGDSKNTAGPALAGIVGRVAGQGTNFPYSKALKEAEITWTEKHLFAFYQQSCKTYPRK